VDIFDFYADPEKHDELAALLTLGAQQHPLGLAPSFLEKDIWVTEILRILYDENLMGNMSIAFKGGTALSKCWGAIERFSEDIDLSIHWAELAGTEDETVEWEKTTKSRSQNSKFRKRQEQKLTEWVNDLVEKLNSRFVEYGIDGLKAELEAGSNAEKIDILFPRVTTNDNQYHLDHVLLEFGGRNRGRPTSPHNISCYLAEVPDLSEISFPTASVQAYNPDYILWEKLTALHQFSTQTKDLKAGRLARHWYDVDCLLKNKFADPLNSRQAMEDVVEMKKHRWAVTGVDFENVLNGKLQLIPAKGRLAEITADHQKAVIGGMFFSIPSDFSDIILRLENAQREINSANDPLNKIGIIKNVRWVSSGCWHQAIGTYRGCTFRSEMMLTKNTEKALRTIKEKVTEKLLLK